LSDHHEQNGGQFGVDSFGMRILETCHIESLKDLQREAIEMLGDG